MRKIVLFFAASIVAVMALPFVSTPAYAYSYGDTLRNKVEICLMRGGVPDGSESHRVGANRYVPYLWCIMPDGSRVLI